MRLDPRYPGLGQAFVFPKSCFISKSNNFTSLKNRGKNVNYRQVEKNILDKERSF